MDFDFNIILVPITLVLGFVWLLDKLWLKNRRTSGNGHGSAGKDVQSAQAALNKHRQEFSEALTTHNIPHDSLDSVVITDDTPLEVRQAQRHYRDAKRFASVTTTQTQPQDDNFLVRWAQDYFFVILIVLVVRSFIIEPFNIPSSSMVPTLYTGDFVAVNKSAYGIRLPLINTKIIDTGSPKHGDVAVFRFPEDPRVNYIKRVIGLPGDTVSYDDGKLSLNGELVTQGNVEFTADNTLTERMYKPVKNNDDLNQEWYLSPEEAVLMATNEEAGAFYNREQLGDHSYLRRHLDPSLYMTDFSTLLNKPLDGSNSWRITVPEDSYFVMGDNTDRSKDGRYWGFVPDENLSGKAFYVWMHKKPGLSNLPTFSYNRSID